MSSLKVLDETNDAIVVNKIAGRISKKLSGIKLLRIKF